MFRMCIITNHGLHWWFQTSRYSIWMMKLPVVMCVTRMMILIKYVAINNDDNDIVAIMWSLRFWISHLLFRSPIKESAGGMEYKREDYWILGGMAMPIMQELSWEDTQISSTFFLFCSISNGRKKPIWNKHLVVFRMSPSMLFVELILMASNSFIDTEEKMSESKIRIVGHWVRKRGVFDYLEEHRHCHSLYSPSVVQQGDWAAHLSWRWIAWRNSIFVLLSSTLL